MTWQIFVLINLITSSLIVPLQRLLLRQDKSDPITFIVVSQLLTGLLLVPFIAVNGFHMPDLNKLGLLMLAMFLLYALGHYLYANTLKQVEASIFSTLLNTSTVWVVLMGYLVLNETLEVTDVLGTMLILLSVFVVMERKKRIYHLDKSIYMGLLTGFIFGVALSMWVYIGKHSDLLSWTFISFMGTPFIFLITNPKIARKARHYLRSKLLISMLILGVVWAVDNLASLAAFQRGNVSIVAPLLQASTILSVIVAIIFLHERSRIKSKIVASLICFVGVAILIRQ